MDAFARDGGTPDPRVVKEGGYGPTQDPGAVPRILIQKADRRKRPGRLLVEPGGADARLFKSLAHELRVEILEILNEREASPNELAKLLDEGLSQVSYHVKVLKDYGVIEQTKTEPRRGAVEHYYRAKPVEAVPRVLEVMAPEEPLVPQDPAGD